MYGNMKSQLVIIVNLDVFFFFINTRSHPEKKKSVICHRRIYFEECLSLKNSETPLIFIAWMDNSVETMSLSRNTNIFYKVSSFVFYRGQIHEFNKRWRYYPNLVPDGQ